MNIRVAPHAVCRQILANLQTHKPLTENEVERILIAVENTRVADAVERLLADTSRNTLVAVLDKI